MRTVIDAVDHVSIGIQQFAHVTNRFWQIQEMLDDIEAEDYVRRRYAGDSLLDRVSDEGYLVAPADAKWTVESFELIVQTVCRTTPDISEKTIHGDKASSARRYEQRGEAESITGPDLHHNLALDRARRIAQEIELGPDLARFELRRG